MLNNIIDVFLTLKGIIKYQTFLKRSDYFNDSEIYRLQSIWLNNLLRHSYDNIPWYASKFRLHDVVLDSDNPFRELGKLPILYKSDIRSNHADFCISNAAKTSLKFATSGTTGEPLVSYTSKSQWIIEQATIWRQWKRAGYKFRDKVAIFRSHAPKVGESSMRMDYLRNWAYFSAFRMDDKSIDEYVNFLRDWRPRFLRGYPSSLLILAQHAIKYGWKLPGLVAAFSASETVHPALRSTLEEAFGIPLFDHYGQAEISCMFHDCEKHEGMHLDWEYGFVELIPSDEPGFYRIIATNFHNTSMPLLRYDTGDLAYGGWSKCSCGRSSPVLKDLRGRSDDFLIKVDGTRMPTVNLYTYFSKVKEIERCQLTQEKPGELLVSYTLRTMQQGELINNKLAQKIINELQNVTGMNIKVKAPPEFIQSKEGKFSMFIQRIPK